MLFDCCDSWLNLQNQRKDVCRLLLNFPAEAHSLPIPTVTETEDYSHRLRRHKNVHNFLLTLISKTRPQLIRAIIGLLESATFHLHLRILSLFFHHDVKMLWEFFGPRGDDRSLTPPCFKKRRFPAWNNSGNPLPTPVQG